MQSIVTLLSLVAGAVVVVLAQTQLGHPEALEVMLLVSAVLVLGVVGELRAALRCESASTAGISRQHGDSARLGTEHQHWRQTRTHGIRHS